MRGTGNRTIEDHKKVRITPAHAGNSRGISWPSFASRDHPRSCGEQAILEIITQA